MARPKIKPLEQHLVEEAVATIRKHSDSALKNWNCLSVNDITVLQRIAAQMKKENF